MAVELPARGIRVGGVTIAPGEARAVAIPLAGQAGDGTRARAVPAWVAVGARPGPRVTVVAASLGIEAVAARAAAHLAGRLDPDGLAGSVVVVPVLRAGGRLAAAGRATAPMSFPGEAGGDRAARDAFMLFSDLVIGAQALIVLGVPNRGRRGLLVARVSPEDARGRRLALQSGAALVVQRSPRPGSLAGAAAAVPVPVVELSAFAGPGNPGAADPLVNGARALLAAAGVLIEPLTDAAPETKAAAPSSPTRMVRLVAPADGFLEPRATAGDLVRARQELGSLEPWLPAATATISAPWAALVVEAAPPGAVREGATLFTLVPAPPRAPGARPQPSGQASDKTRVGWVELVALPALGVDRLKAKIDTGARTSALHVTRMRVVDTTGGPHRRPILEITVPGGRRPTVVRVTVRAYAMVRDTSGRIERRPVIETVLKLGPMQRRITVTLTNRGDMLYPMLVGRTALGPGIVVDPSRRYLLPLPARRRESG
jgi:predicted deacylase